MEKLHEQELCAQVLQEKYLKGQEADAQQLMRRVANGLAQAEKADERSQWAERFFSALQAGFIPAGRILSACGTGIQATLVNCFVQPVGDSLSGADESGKPGIYEALRDAAETMRRGGGVGYNFSHIRPQGAPVKGTRSNASGPLSYMRVFHSSCETVESAGARRGAQMGILDISHPDIEQFIDAKRDGGLSNFNLSVAVSDRFMEAVREDRPWNLVHACRPPEAEEGERDSEGRYIWKTLSARSLWDRIMRSTYELGEPGIFFVDRVNQINPLAYAERIEATNPCAEQPLPAYGCCCLGSIDLTRFINRAFTDEASFDFSRFAQVVHVAVRMLDNVLEVTPWPLVEQWEEAMAKRRIGLGFTGLGDALMMCGRVYGSPEAAQWASRVSEAMRDAAYTASALLAGERGTFTLYDASKHLQGEFVSRLPEVVRSLIAQYGLRNSHLMSIAPTGTITLALADNCSNGIEPAFQLRYARRKRRADGTVEEHGALYDHAYRLWLAEGGDPQKLPPEFKATALEISVDAHLAMMQAVQPYVDASISKTVNIPADYDFADFKSVYFKAWQGGLKSIATYRDTAALGAILVPEGREEPQPAAAVSNPEALASNVLRLHSEVDTAPLATLRSLSRPIFADGNPATTYAVRAGRYDFAVTIGEDSAGPFEVWVMGNVPRGLDALAKNLSMDLRSRDRSWIARKLAALLKCHGDTGEEVTLRFPPDGAERHFPGIVSAFAALLQYHLAKTGTIADQMPKGVLTETMLTDHEPQTGPAGTGSWCVDIDNGEDRLVVFTKTLQVMPSGVQRPYSLWIAGDYPRTFDGLAKSLSLDMRVADPSWIARKLRQLHDYSEPRGEFWAKAAGTQRSRQFPSTIAYMAELLETRFRTLGLIEGEGGATAIPQGDVVAMHEGKRCPHCGGPMAKRDGCEVCLDCMRTGTCG